MCTSPLLVRHPRLRSLTFQAAAAALAEADCKVSPKLYVKNTLPEKVLVPCGHCPECVRARSAEWRTRLLHEFENSENAVFVTLTIAPKYYSGIQTPIKDYLRKMFFAYRNVFRSVAGKKEPVPKHWFVTEFGEERGRLHLHGFIFNSKIYTPPNPKDLLSPRISKGKKVYYNHLSTELIRKIWPYGFADVAYSASLKTVSYATKYLTKSSPAYPGYRAPVYTSPGIGKTFAMAHRSYIRNALASGVVPLVQAGRFKVQAPRYYRRLVLTEREAMELSDVLSRRRLYGIVPFVARCDGFEFTTLEEYLSYCKKKGGTTWAGLNLDKSVRIKNDAPRIMEVNPVKYAIYTELMLNYRLTEQEMILGEERLLDPFNLFDYGDFERGVDEYPLELFEPRA